MCGAVYGSYISQFFNPNVRGQGTRHLVAGTLDPIVRLTFLLPLSKVPVAEIGIDRFPSVGSDWGSHISMRGQERQSVGLFRRRGKNSKSVWFGRRSAQYILPIRPGVGCRFGI